MARKRSVRSTKPSLSGLKNTGKNPRAKKVKKRSGISAARRAPSKPSKEKVFPVVGIGASAGGLDAFTKLLKNVPRDTGMAFVLVQHLAPESESVLDEILARETRIPVSVVKNGMAVEPDNIYVIPPNKDMFISKGTLKLIPPVKVRGGRMPVDYFFRSLARDRGVNAIGVVLSGTASDGTMGLKEIKDAGGITFAQDERTAKYTGMPRSAIAGGCVDFISSPEKIAKELARISRHPYLRHPVVSDMDKVFPQKGDVLHKIFAMLRDVTGIDFTHYKHSTVKRRIRRRMLLHKTRTLDKYVEYLRKDRAELRALKEDILINVTSFFRDPEAFKALKEKVFPVIMKGRLPGVPVRIWVPGCSTGEEVYSLIISFLEFLGDRAGSTPVQVFATDISDNALEKARRGIYPESIRDNVSPDRLKRFFVKVENEYCINKSIRDMCVFAQHDITKDPPFSNLDLVSCQNVLIYLESVLQKRVIPMFHYALRQDGFLVLGSSEGVGVFSSLFKPVDKKNKIYSRKQAAARLGYDFGPGYYRADKMILAPDISERPPRLFNVQDEADRILLNKYAPTSVLVNSDIEVLRFWGHSGRYMEHVSGKASLNLMKIIREGLRVDLRAAIHEARGKKDKVKKEKIPFKQNGQEKYINIEVDPIKVPQSKECYFLILFEDVTPAAAGGTDRIKPAKRKIKAERGEHEAAHLQEELDRTREYLQSVIEGHEATNEELRSSLEELQSSNEELQSTNEELETAKEELQSLNEELATVNEELANRNAELDRLNNDMINLLNSVNIPIVMLGDNLCIRRFNPAAQNVLNLIPGDVGRRFTDIKPNIDIPDLEDMILEVLDTLGVKEKEVKDNRGHWYSVRIRPYRTMENKIEGVVITLLDIDTVKRSLDRVEKARNYAENIIATVREPLVVLDADLKVISANRSFYRTFKAKPKETENTLIYDLGDKQWNIPELKKLLGEILARKTEFLDFRVEHDFPEIGPRVMLLNARKVRGKEYSEDMILLAMEDITDRVKREQIKESLIRNVSHSLKTPLATAEMALYMCEKGLKARNMEKITQGKRMACESIERLRKDIDNILSMYIMGEKKKETVSLRRIIDEILRDERALIEKKKDEIRMNIGRDADSIKANPRDLKHLMGNIVNNAVKFTEHGRITITSKLKDKWIEINVKDTGCGIATEALDKVFDKFYQRHAAVGGTGLGLSISKDIVEKYGGRIAVRSKGPGQGTAVKVRLPVK